MKKYKKHYEEEEIPKEMINWFKERTKKHIDLVKKYGGLILNNIDLKSSINIPKFLHDIHEHDQSKFLEPEKTPYIYISWDYHCKDLQIPFQIPKEIIEQTNKASNIHVCNNKHHPEYWMKNKTLDVINRSDRDQPNDFLIDCTLMPLTYIASMCTDWMAMSDEKGTSPQEWAKKNINIRWRFTKEQENFIYKILDTIWK